MGVRALNFSGMNYFTFNQKVSAGNRVIDIFFIVAKNASNAVSAHAHVATVGIEHIDRGALFTSGLHRRLMQQHHSISSDAKMRIAQLANVFRRENRGYYLGWQTAHNKVISKSVPLGERKCWK